MQSRRNALNTWLRSCLSNEPFILLPLAGDASFRRYYRLTQATSSYVVMDAPPPKEEIGPFVTLARHLRTLGLHTPAIVAQAPTAGFLLLEDLGDQVFLKTLTEENAERLYQRAMDTLLCLQQTPPPSLKLPSFDVSFMHQEMALFQEWFLNAHLGLTLTTTESILLNGALNWLASNIATQPQVLIHRDFHSRNLMVLGNEALAVLDFQDAMVGPAAYDLVSLLKDCYIQWPTTRITHWIQYFYSHLPEPRSLSGAAFTRAFTVCGLQRHLKVLGIFCRLHLRDNKSNYLSDLPLTFQYVMNALPECPELLPLQHLMEDKVCTRFADLVS